MAYFGSGYYDALGFTPGDELTGYNTIGGGFGGTNVGGYGSPQQADDAPWWAGISRRLLGREPDGTQTQESLASQRQTISGLQGLGSAFENVGGGTISSLPTPYSGPPVTMGQNQDMGLQALVQMLLAGGAIR